MAIGAADPTGGSGLQADILTLASMGCHPLSVLTTVTIQDTAGVEDVLTLDAEWVSGQARTVLQDIPVSAFKLGMLGSVEMIAAIAEIIADYPNVPLVMDAALVAWRGRRLAGESLRFAARELLIPRATVLTAGRSEMRRLALGRADEDDETGDSGVEDCAQRLIDRGARYVLATGIRENASQVVNILFGRQGRVRTDSWERLQGSYHGHGCTLAAAIAANLANGADLEEAVLDAQEYAWRALAAGFRPGMGRYLPDRFFWAREAAGEL